jgi:hypothetical protein
MQHHIQTLVKHFFRKDSLQEVALAQLQQFAAEYPYAATAQLLLAKKLYDTGSPDLAEQGEKLSLYFNDPVWAAWLLRNGSNGADSNYDHLFAKEETTQEQPGFSFASVALQHESNETAPPFQTDAVVTSAGVQEAATEQSVANPAEANTTTDGHEAAEQMQQETSGDTALPSSPALNVSVSDKPVAADATADTETPSVPAANNTATTKPMASDATPGAQTHAGPALKETPAATPIGGDIPFEPYHTIDYFASVGIKLKPEDLTKDKLGQQLKSFTEWLRTMKRIGPNPDAAVIRELDEATNQTIQRIAEHSNEANEIITEAMAEVWAKQGHTDRAIAIYEKLSLLNPAKSHYFAGKIEALKAL